MELKATVTTKGKIFEGKAPEIIQQNLQSAMNEAVMLLEREVKLGTPTGVFGTSGGLVSRIYGEVFEMGKKGIVGHTSPYGDVIELGRRPGKAWPPEGSLQRWIEEKIAAPLRTVGSIGQAVTVTRWRKSLEFVIRRKIGQKGFPGAHMFERAFKKNWPRVKEIFDRMGFKITKEINQ